MSYEFWGFLEAGPAGQSIGMNVKMLTFAGPVSDIQAALSDSLYKMTHLPH